MPFRRADGHRKGGDAQVGLGFAAPGGEPKQVGFGGSGVTAVGMGGVYQAGQVEQDEGELEGPPTAVTGEVEGFEGGFFALADGAAVQGVDPLQGHRPVGKAEGCGGLGVGVEQGDPVPDAGEGFAAGVEGQGGVGGVGVQVGGLSGQAGFLGGDPGGVGGDEGGEGGGKRAGGGIGQGPHVQHQPG